MELPESTRALHLLKPTTWIKGNLSDPDLTFEENISWATLWYASNSLGARPIEGCVSLN